MMSNFSCITLHAMKKKKFPELNVSWHPILSGSPTVISTVHDGLRHSEGGIRGQTSPPERANVTVLGLPRR